ncbi:MT-A70 family methyltransferase [Winslowiella arboricola]|uniref:MT-A70 family methyltransferase n=1 Tax=Winslowiella arboricola TaxID=2978220 RepID=UPI00225E3EC7|nr:MT-A70 family methyltransferase [Winslowiella arboricola]MCU5775206.1 MT-A70 family methyltransferase [Winslowiella arboricola]
MKYGLIYADPPWSYGNTISNGAANDHYSTMTLTDIKRLPVWELAEDNAVLVMWYTGTHVDEARAVAEAWGFDVRQMFLFTWIKFNGQAEQRFNKALEQQTVYDFDELLMMLNAETRMNPGNYSRGNQESALVAVRGNGLERASRSVKQVIYSCQGQHSEKPAEARYRLEELYGDVSRIELFARQQNEGWDTWGNECDSSVRLIGGRVA